MPAKTAAKQTNASNAHKAAVDHGVSLKSVYITVKPIVMPIHKAARQREKVVMKSFFFMSVTYLVADAADCAYGIAAFLKLLSEGTDVYINCTAFTVERIPPYLVEYLVS